MAKKVGNTYYFTGKGKSSGGGGGGGDATDAVKYTAQALTDPQKEQARANIGAGTSDFSGAYSDLTGKPTIPAEITTVSVTVDNNTGTPSGTATVSGNTLTLSFSNLKGATGATGEQGPQGLQGPVGPQGLQGNTGSSVDYPYELVNNLTTDDATQGLSAAMGRALDEKIDSGIINPLGEEITVTLPPANIVANMYCSTVGSSYSTNSYYSIYYFAVPKRSLFTYKLANKSLSTGVAISVADAIPANGVAYTAIVKQDPEVEGTFYAGPNQYVGLLIPNGNNTYLPTVLKYQEVLTINIPEQLAALDEGISEFTKMREFELLPSYFLGKRLIDTLTRTRWFHSTDTKIGNFTPVAATAGSITLSAGDAACIARVVILACKMSGGAYRYAYFSAASSNIITKLYDFGQEIDCQDIISLESIHDTIEGAQGQHLSPYGYRAMAWDIYEKLGSSQQFGDIFLGGWAAQYCQGSTGYTDPVIRDSTGAVVCTPVLTGINAGGAFDRCEMIYAQSLTQQATNANTYYYIAQSAPAGATAQFDLKAKYKFKGFLRVLASKDLAYSGAVTMTVKDAEGNTIATRTINALLDSYIIPLNAKYYDGVSVIFSMPDSQQTVVKILEMTLHETYAVSPQFRRIDSSSVVALLGSSNTQFPELATAQTLCPGDPDNVVVTRPDGTTGDGCGYLGKELARISGATVDNWGKSGEQTPYGLAMLDKIFAEKAYTHIVLSLFANDINAARPMKNIIANIRQMAEYAIGHGCMPIILMGYGTASSSQMANYVLVYDDLTEGFDNILIADYAERHSA